MVRQYYITFKLIRYGEQWNERMNAMNSNDSCQGNVWQHNRHALQQCRSKNLDLWFIEICTSSVRKHKHIHNSRELTHWLSQRTWWQTEWHTMSITYIWLLPSCLLLFLSSLVLSVPAHKFNGAQNGERHTIVFEDATTESILFGFLPKNPLPRFTFSYSKTTQQNVTMYSKLFIYT